MEFCTPVVPKPCPVVRGFARCWPILCRRLKHQQHKAKRSLAAIEGFGAQSGSLLAEKCQDLPIILAMSLQSSQKEALGCRRVRVFGFATGKLRRSYDESIEAAQDLQKNGGDTTKLDAIDFGRRLAVRNHCSSSRVQAIS